MQLINKFFKFDRVRQDLPCSDGSIFGVYGGKVDLGMRPPTSPSCRHYKSESINATPGGKAEKNEVFVERSNEQEIFDMYYILVLNNFQEDCCHAKKY